MTTTINPDAYMGRPIDSLIWGAALIVNRIVQWCRLPEEERAQEPVRSLIATDDQMLVAYRAAIRLRADEVCARLKRQGIRCTPDQVRSDPFGVCYAAEVDRGGIYAGEAASPPADDSGA